MRAPVATAIAISIGLIILAGYVLPGLLPEPAAALLLSVRTFLLGWAAILAGVATLVGIINLVLVHVRRLRERPGHKRDWYSVVLVLAFIGTVGAGIAMGPENAGFQRLVTAVQEPIEISLLALLAVTLAYASLRLLRRRSNLMSILFVASALLFLLLATGIFSSLPDGPLAGVVRFFSRLPVAGARGILLGVGLGSLLTGLRILLGADRPYSG